MSGGDEGGAVGDYIVVSERVTYYRQLSQEDKARLVLPEDLVYEGAIKFPGRAPGALTYCPQGDPGGLDDGYPGSIFGATDRGVLEISIPKPVISPTKNYDDLNTAGTLQPLADITGGLKDSKTGHWEHLDTLGGLAWLPAMGQQASPKLYWCFYWYYNVSHMNQFGHGWSETNLANPQPNGNWHVGPFGDANYHSQKTTEYIFEIPKDWADTYVGGKRLACGKGDGCGSGGVSGGPAIYAYAPWQDGKPPPDKAELSAVILLMYPADSNYMQPP